MNNIKEAFNHSFEQVAYDKEPEFKIHGIGYQGKWGKDTMSMFIKDLESVEDGYKDNQTETIATLKDKVSSLEGQVEDLEAELKEAKAGE